MGRRDLSPTTYLQCLRPLVGIARTNATVIVDLAKRVSGDAPPPARLLRRDSAPSRSLFAQSREEEGASAEHQDRQEDKIPIVGRLCDSGKN